VSIAQGSMTNLANVMNCADIRVIESGGGLGFAAEPTQGLRIFGELLGEEFRGDEAIQARVLCFVYYSHSAACRASRRCGNARWSGRSLG